VLLREFSEHIHSPASPAVPRGDPRSGKRDRVDSFYFGFLFRHFEINFSALPTLPSVSDASTAAAADAS